MTASGRRKYLYFFIAFILFATFLEIVGGLLINSYSSYDYNGINNYRNIRQILLGNSGSNLLPRFTGHANLNYIQTPGFTEFGDKQVNEQGFRGDTLALKKTINTIRILFLGGSTTFGMALGDYKLAFPFKVGDKLDDLTDKKVEVINAGLMWGTSFELLSHYRYRYKYCNPDMVVIHTGGNDTQAYENMEAYQPDYSHWRKNMEDLKPLNGFGRTLMKSRFLSFIIIRLFYNNAGDNLYVHFNVSAKNPWFPEHTFKEIPDSTFNAFYQNMDDLLYEIVKDSIEVYIMPFVYNDKFDFSYLSMNYKKGIETHNTFMNQLKVKYKLNWIDISNNDFTTDMWIDDCHLYESGHDVKAKFIYNEILINRLE